MGTAGQERQGGREQAASRFDLVMRATRDAVWDWNVSTGETWWNLRQFELLGYDPETTVPSHDAWVRRIHPADRQRVIQHFEETVASGAAVWQCEYRFTRGEGGAVRVALDRGCIQRDEQGRLIRVAGIIADVTSETAQRELEQQLARAQRLESIGRLAGGIAHDFNNLLTIILGSVDMQLLEASPSPSQRADLAAIKEAGERAATLTSQLLSFARRQAVAPARLDLAEVARQTEQMLRRVIGEHVELHTVLDPEPCNVLADRAQLEQVLVNLVINARDAMPNGGRASIEVRKVSVGLPGSDPALSRAELAPGEYVLLSVSDTGVGISGEVLPLVFEPFFTTKPVGQGTGLGLATCYGIVQQAGGTILVDSQIGAGTTFSILLPRAKPDSAAPASRAPRASVSGGTETVLFVEDDPCVRRVGVQILAAHDYAVLEAESGARALDAVAAHSGPIHLLVTDVVMPGLSGTALARRLRSAQPDLRVLYCSGYTEDSVVRQSAPERRTAFLQKPYTRETLLEKVRGLLDTDL